MLEGRRRHAITTAAVAVAIAIGGTGAAEARVAKGDYTCTSFGGFAGTLNILSQEKYSVNDGRRGKLVVRGKRLKFKTGDYKGVWKGRVTSRKNIDLHFFDTGDYGMSCGR